MAKSLREDSYANVSFSGVHISYWDLAKLFDRRRSAPRHLEDEKKLESGWDGTCQIRAGQVGAGQFRVGQVSAVQASTSPTQNFAAGPSVAHDVTAACEPMNILRYSKM
jgi:hypothetical protein